MLLKVLALLGIASSIAWCAHGHHRRRPVVVAVTVLLGFDQPHSEASLRVMEKEAYSILKDTGVRVDWRLRSEMSDGDQFGNLVSFQLHGHCSMESEPEKVDESGPLAKAYASDGTVLHFGEVECDRIQATVRRTLGPSPYRFADDLLGKAMGRVLAHEMYHILGNELDHTKGGLTRSGLTADDLFRGKASFAGPATERLALEYKGY